MEIRVVYVQECREFPRAWVVSALLFQDEMQIMGPSWSVRVQYPFRISSFSGSKDQLVKNENDGPRCMTASHLDNLISPRKVFLNIADKCVCKGETRAKL
jgi:hypothetical protein